MKIKILRPFGPSISKIEIPKEIISTLNNYIDQIIIDKNKSSELDHGANLVGNVKQEFRIEEDLLKSSGFHDLLFKGVKKWIEVSENKNVTKFNILSSWVVRQFENEYNPVHWHSGHLSGAGFLKVPNNLGSFIQKKDAKDYPGGMLELIHGSKAFLSDAKFRIKPEIGDFYFFPNYLMHTVYPFKDTKEERRSISFNAKIDEEIYNDFS
jgi:hypothetical protein